MSKLARIMGCHQKPERSFHFKGKPLPICARCTGILIGIFSSIIFFIFFPNISPWFIFLFLVPGLLDGFVQLKTKYRSNNFKRLITGILLGFGCVFHFVLVYHEFYKLALIIKY